MVFSLFSNPIFFLVWTAAIILALSIHEFSHALIATLLGDQTAKQQGRLTLNPMAHVDPLGFLMLIVAGFGWGKPVPFNPYNLRIQRWGPTLVALGGPLSNLLSVIVFGTVLLFLRSNTNLGSENLLIIFLSLLILISAMLFLFNLLPIPPLDGSKFLFSILSSPKYDRVRYMLETRGPFILLALIILDNFLPISIFGSIFGGVLFFLAKTFGVVV